MREPVMGSVRYEPITDKFLEDGTQCTVRTTIVREILLIPSLVARIRVYDMDL